MEKPLQKEFDYFLKNQTQLVEKYLGKFIVIKDETVIGSYDDETAAIWETAKTHKLGTFLVQECLPGKDVYTRTFHSRVRIAV